METEGAQFWMEQRQLRSGGVTGGVLGAGRLPQGFLGASAQLQEGESEAYAGFPRSKA